MGSWRFATNDELGCGTVLSLGLVLFLTGTVPFPSRIMGTEFTSCRSAGRCHLNTVTEKDWYEKARRPAELHELFPR